MTFSFHFVLSVSVLLSKKTLARKRASLALAGAHSTPYFEAARLKPSKNFSVV